MADAELDNEYTRSRSIQSDRMTGKDRIGRTVLATFIAALGPLSFGYCLGYSSSALEDLEKANAPSAVHLSVDQGAWFSVSVSCFCSVIYFCSTCVVPSEREYLLSFDQSLCKLI